MTATQTMTAIRPHHRYTANVEIHRLTVLRALADRAARTGGHAYPFTETDATVLRALQIAVYAEGFPASYPPALVTAAEVLIGLCHTNTFHTDDSVHTPAVVTAADAVLAAHQKAGLR